MEVISGGFPDSKNLLVDLPFGTHSNSPICSYFFFWECQTLLTTHFSFTRHGFSPMAFALRHHDHLARPWIRLQHHCHGQLRPNDPKTQPQLSRLGGWDEILCKVLMNIVSYCFLETKVAILKWCKFSLKWLGSQQVDEFQELLFLQNHQNWWLLRDFFGESTTNLQHQPLSLPGPSLRTVAFSSPFSGPVFVYTPTTSPIPKVAFIHLLLLIPPRILFFFCKFEAPAKPVRTSAGAAISSFLWIYSLVFQQPLAKRSWGAVALVVQETASANSQSKTQSDFCEGLQAGKAISQLTPYLKKTAVHDSVSLIFTRGEFWKIQQQNQWTLGREIESRA